MKKRSTRKYLRGPYKKRKPPSADVEETHPVEAPTTHSCRTPARSLTLVDLVEMIALALKEKGLRAERVSISYPKDFRSTSYATIFLQSHKDFESAQISETVISLIGATTKNKGR